MKNFKKVFAFLLAFVFIAALVKVPFKTKADETVAQSVIVKIKYSRADMIIQIGMSGHGMKKEILVLQRNFKE